MKIGPGAEVELAGALVVDRRAGDVGRHQVGRELDAREARARWPARSERAISVLARPGKSSSSTWPSASRPSSTSSSASRLPTTARSTSSSIALGELADLLERQLSLHRRRSLDPLQPVDCSAEPREREAGREAVAAAARGRDGRAPRAPAPSAAAPPPSRRRGRVRVPRSRGGRRPPRADTGRSRACRSNALPAAQRRRSRSRLSSSSGRSRTAAAARERAVVEPRAARSPPGERRPAHEHEQQEPPTSSTHPSSKRSRETGRDDHDAASRARTSTPRSPRRRGPA